MKSNGISGPQLETLQNKLKRQEHLQQVLEDEKNLKEEIEK